LGVAGPFIAMFGEDAERLLDADDWNHLTTSVRERFDGKDVRRSEVEASFGRPSLVIENAYSATPPPTRLDGSLSTASRNAEAASTWQALDATSGDETMIHWYGRCAVPRRMSDEKHAIAAQLRDVEAGDPSQALRPPRGDPMR
jgi:hypothetical protein